MTKINIGFPIDLEKLIETRALIQANSGGGKSYLMRKIIEEVHGKIPFIVLDLEGEFITIREKYDVIVFGQGHDIPINIQYADKLARYLLELSASAIIDLSELKHHERILFVKRFLESMINAPKNLWHPTLVFLDEAHQFCPEDSRAESMQAVIDLCTRGRKRGYCAILATQRLSKLHKDAAAELNNKMIGRTTLDVDVKRTSSELGMSNTDAKQLLRQLDDGEFYVFGPAISQDITKQKVSKVHTTHAKAGMKFSKITPPSKAMQKIIGKIAEIPAEVEKEKDTVKSLQEEIKLLKANSKNKPLQAVGPSLVLDLKKELSVHQAVIKQYEAKLKNLPNSIQKLKTTTDAGFSVILKLIEEGKIISPDKKTELISVANPDRFKLIEKNIPISLQNQIYSSTELGKCEKAILTVLAQRCTKPTSKSQAGILSGYSSGSGGFNNSISKLKTMGFIKGNSDNLMATEEGILHLGSVEILPTGEELHRYWLSKLGKCEAEILKVLIEIHPQAISKEDLGLRSGYSSGSGGFNNSISKLRTLELLEGRGGYFNASNSLFE